MDEQHRMICLFAYEEQGGREALLWKNPLFFGHYTGQAGKELDRAYDAWRSCKRPFTKDEVLQGKWIKISDHGYSFVVQFHPNGTLVETNMFHPFDRGSGSWELLGAVLRMRVGNYELDIFANCNDVIHSGIEIEHGRYQPHAVFKVIHLK